jgi:uncharacterized protein YebE (UPF0316 family)
MWEWMQTAPVWMLALTIFSLRVCDVSIGTIRTIFVVEGRIVLSVLLGIFETLVWLTAVAQVLQHATSSPLMMMAFALGFAAGNAVGILVQRRLALGNVILRIISSSSAPELDHYLRTHCQRVIAFPGTEAGRSTTLLYAVVRRRSVKDLIDEISRIDPQLFYAVEPLRESNIDTLGPMPQAASWRAALRF